MCTAWSQFVCVFWVYKDDSKEIFPASDGMYILCTFSQNVYNLSMVLFSHIKALIIGVFLFYVQ